MRKLQVKTLREVAHYRLRWRFLFSEVETHSQLPERYYGIGNLADRPRSGRPPILAAAQKCHIRLLVARDPTINATKLKAEIRATPGLEVSTQTIRNCLHKAGLRARRSWRAPLNSRDYSGLGSGKTKKTKRKTFGKTASSLTNRESVLNQITDVSVFGDSERQRTATGTVQKGKKSVYFWGVAIDGIVRPFRVNHGYQFVLVGNNAPAHRAQRVNAALREYEITRLDWPAGSPDLNPIEYALDDLKRSVWNLQPPPQTVPQLREASVQEWDSKHAFGGNCTAVRAEVASALALSGWLKWVNAGVARGARAQSRSHRRRGRTLAMYRLLVTLLALAALAAAEPPRPRLIDFNPFAWLPTNNNRSPSIMDYFFPPSRTPKQSSLDPPADRKPPPTTITDTNLDNTPAPTTIEERSTTYSRKVSTKTKTTVPATATIPPKTKKGTRKPVNVETTYETKTTQKIESLPTFKVTTVPTTYRPTKHYSIRPVVRTTETPTVQDTETTNSDSTETVSEFETAGTTIEVAKETVPTFSTVDEPKSTDAGIASTATIESTTPTDATAEPADSREGYLPLRDKPQQTHVKINDQTKKETVPLPAGSTSVLAKPTKYHYYPHNQHIYLLPECAIQQVCNAVYVRLNYTQPLCACPARYRDPCSASLNADDLHTTRLTTDSKKKYAYKAVTLVKTCEAVQEMRECRAPRDWSLLALQNIRTGKSHYLVICRCPENHILEGPMSHDQPTYASVPGIRVYGMMCVRPSNSYNTGYNANRFSSTGIQSTTTSTYKVDYSQPHPYPDKPVYNRYHSHTYPEPTYYNRRSRVARMKRSTLGYPPFPWYKVKELARSLHWID
ncbi:hypothetical protein evm_011862 [Chilo suppressalis]|nr:hypothetical protein evm_011862 [Chilo suppressalis]